MKSRKKIGIVVSVALFAALLLSGGILLGWNQFYLTITLEGDKDLTIPYGEVYQEPGYTVVFGGTRLFRQPREMDLPVVTEGQVPQNQVGSFEITYQVRKLWLTGEAKRVVHVVDRIPPEIHLVGGDQPETEDGIYREEGFTAQDNADGDLTIR